MMDRAITESVATGAEAVEVAAEDVVIGESREAVTITRGTRP